jgi:hypothetical protein
MDIDDEVAKLLGRDFAPAPQPPPDFAPRPLQDDDEKYNAIVDDLRGGVSYSVITKKHKTARQTISAIAKREGLLRPHSPGTEAHSTYTREKRVTLLDQLFVKLEELLEDVKTPKDFQILVAAMGVLVEKRRIEDGDPNASPAATLSGAKERLQGKIDLVARRLKTTPDPRSKNQTGAAVAEAEPDTDAEDDEFVPEGGDPA